MKTLIITVSMLVLLLAFICPSSMADNFKGQWGVRGGLGTDVNLGIAYGVGGGYLMPMQQNYVEFGVVLFGGSFDETSNNGFNDYDETTDIFVFGAMANFLIGFQPYQDRTYFIAGIGLASVSMTWEERSTTDISLGTPLPGGGSMQSLDGGAGGSILNLGVGHSMSNGLDLRAELPVILAFSAPGEATSVIPTLIVTLGYRF